MHKEIIYQERSNLGVKKVKDFTSTRIFLIVLLLLAVGGATRDKPCLLSVARLERLGSVVANLAIN
jgi:hypothetical protein